MTGVLTRSVEQTQMQRCSEKMSRNEGSKDWSDALNQELAGILEPKRKVWNRFSTEPSERAWPY